MIYDKQKFKCIAAILKAIAHPIRLRIILLLADENSLPVSAIAQAIGIPKNKASQHLVQLQIRGFLVKNRNGKSILYSLKETALLDLIDKTDSIYLSGTDEANDIKY